jgi:hypothetical protein
MAGFMFSATESSTPKMVAAGPSKPLVPVCERIHSSTQDIFIVTTVRTSDITMAFSFNFFYLARGKF